MTHKQRVQNLYPSAHVEFYREAKFKYEVWIDEPKNFWCVGVATTPSGAWKKAAGLIDKYMLSILSS